VNPIAALLTLALHLSLLLSLPHEEEKQPKKAPPSVDLVSGDVELMPKQETLDAYAMHIDCPHTYEGIGIKRNFGGMVTQVAKGWPADRAGIQVGDVIEPWNFEPVDGFMEFEVIRGAKRVKMKLRTAQICFRDLPF
jgi:PDZ domain